MITYTAILGGFPNTLCQPGKGAGFGQDFVAFVDGSPDSLVPDFRDGWETRPQDARDNPRRTARLLKVLAHKAFPHVEYTLWVDGCLTPLTPMWQLVDRFLYNHDICVFEHLERGCVYRELEACIRMKKDDPAVMRDQVNRYREEGYPYNHGLGETTAVLRRHNKVTQAFNEAWWDEIKRGSMRDQLSFNYVCWKLGVEYATFEGNRVKSPHFRHRPHR